MVFVPATEIVDDVERMQRVAREVHFSEVAFLVPDGPDVAYRARFFTPERELAYAGHPTLGSAVVWAHETAPMAERLHLTQATQGARAQVVVERRSGTTVAEVAAPRPTWGATSEARGAARALGLTEAARTGCEAPFVATAPVPQAFVEVPRALLPTLHPDAAALRRFGEATGVSLVYAYALATQPDGGIEARGFASALGIGEDPATGSAAGTLGYALAAQGRLSEGTRCTIGQGEAVGRPSAIVLRYAEGTVYVGGRVRFVGSGRLMSEFLA